MVNSGGKTLSFAAGQDTSWHQWAVTFDMSTDGGTLRSTATESTEASVTDVRPIQGAGQTLLLGKSGSIFFGGGVDEVRVWSVARTTAEIQDNLALDPFTSRPT